MKWFVYLKTLMFTIKRYNNKNIGLIVLDFGLNIV